MHLLCFALLSAVCSNVNAAVNTYGMKAGFVRNSTLIETSDVASNLFRVNNNTGKTVRFHLNYSLPSGWSVLGKTDKEFALNDNDSLFIPVRVIPDKNIQGGTSYVITIILASDKNVQFAAENWYVSMPSVSKWTAQLPVKSQFFINSVDSSGFTVYIKNDGNADENIRLTLIPDRRLEILRQSDGGALIRSFTVPVSAGGDTTLIFPVICKPSMTINKGRDADLKSTPTKESYSIQVIAKSTSSPKSWSATMQFTKAGNLARLYEYGRTSVPLTLEANVYDVLSNGTTMSLDAYGNTAFKGGRLLNYRFQTVFVTNFLNENSLLGNNHYIGYFDNNSSLEIGEVNGWGRSLLTGRGIKGSYRYGINTIGGILTRSPGFFNKYQSEGYGFYHNLKWKKFVLNNNYSTNRNVRIDMSNQLISSMLAVKLNTYHQFSIGGGYSIDHSLGKSALGYGYDFNYSGSHRNFCFTVGNSHGSPEYVLARGVDMYSTRTTWSKNQKNTFAFSSQNFTQHPSYFVNGSLLDGNYIRSDRYEFRWGINSKTSSVAIKPSYQWDENRSIRVATKLVGFEYNAKNISHVRVSMTGSMGYSKAVDYTLPEFFVSRFTTYARWEKFYLSLRYTYGPTQLAEQVRFLHDKINPQSVYLIGSYDYWMMNNKILLSTTGNMVYETYFKKVNLRLRPELFYYSGNGIRFSFYASFFTSSQGANPMVDELSGKGAFEKISNTEMNMGFGIRKQFGIPVPGKKFVTMRVIVYKDANGNHKQDANEEGVENMLINVRAKSLFNEDSVSYKTDNGEDMISNEKGEIIYENIPAGIYAIKCTALTQNGEWFDSDNHERKVDSKQTIYIALTKGVRVTGSILLERDKYTNVESNIDLSRIRVTAVDSSGKSYSVLTDYKGGFVINLPASQYILSINDAALGSGFMFIQNKMNIDLSKNFENFSITFNAAERKRKMEIKKFDGKEGIK